MLVLIDHWHECLYSEHYEVKVYRDEKGEILICAILEDPYLPV